MLLNTMNETVRHRREKALLMQPSVLMMALLNKLTFRMMNVRARIILLRTPLGEGGCPADICVLGSDPKNFSVLSRMVQDAEL